MLWQITKSLLIALPMITVAALASAQSQSQNSLINSCNPEFASDGVNLSAQQCSEYLLQLFDQMIVEGEAKMDALAKQQYSDFKREALDTRLSQHTDNPYPNSLAQVCLANGSERPEQVVNVVDNFGYQGEAKVAMINSINGLLSNGNIC